MGRMLVIDDDPLILESFGLGFAEPDYEVSTARTAREGLEKFASAAPDVVLLDVRLPDISGLEAFQKLHQLNPKTPMILMTGHGSAATAIEAMRLGAYEYVVKPFDINTIAELVDGAIQTSRMMRVPARLAADDGPDDATADVLVGQCPAMQEVYRSIGRVAGKDVTVLILGESGTGKEVVARAIYNYSPRAHARFLAINCAAIPEQLLESELFGHEKSSFTGADRKRIGKFELCSEGTLFLDEIGDMSPLMQTKILRVLQDQQFERVGGNETIRTNARVIAATNRNLEQMIADGEFRSDLFYRLNVYTIHLPPLRERGEDLDLLVRHFLKRFGRELNKQVADISPDAMQLIRDYSWPGNIRELQSVVKHILLEATGPLIVPAFIPSFLRNKQAVEPAAAVSPILCLAEQTRQRLEAGSMNIYAEVVSLAERELIGEVLRSTGGNLSLAARRLGISRTTLRGKLALLGISVERHADVEPNRV
ncbi:MAG: sigma-54-dependent transcriptional regulator [Pirellulales bacterium]